MKRAMLLSAAAALAVAAGPAAGPSPASAREAALGRASCADLQGRSFGSARILSAAAVEPHSDYRPEPGQRPVKVDAAFCRVKGAIETEIGFELWLPARTAWNGKFLGAGVGGDAGAFNFQDLPRGVARGYAAGTTDTGHKASDPAWMMGPPERLANYTHRANHLLAESGKRILADYYGSPAKRSYFIGCSGGGRQALKEVQLYPDDYDGVIAGAPGPKTPEMTVRRMWELIQREAQPGLLSPADWKRIADEGVRQCDALDGVKDGVAEDPRQCRFNVRSLQCEPNQTTACLTTEQAAFAARFYAPLRDETGRALDEGILPGVLIDSGRSRLAPATFGQAVRHDPNWKGQDFSTRKDLDAIRRVMPELAADHTDLSAFARHGGKLILYHGWMDPAVAARMTPAYREAVIRRMGPAQTKAFLRLFMVPGMGHCAGGPGADQLGGSGPDAPALDADHDLLTALEGWVEQNRAPEQLIASKLEQGRVVRTHLLCAAPRHAEYDGRGSPDDAKSYSCVS